MNWIVSTARYAVLACVLSVSLAQAGPVEVKVMTRNLYLGADLAPVIAAIQADNPADPSDDVLVGLAVGSAWLKVVNSKPVERLGRVADEILLHKPHVVGLQEASLWETRPSALITGDPLAPFSPTFDFFGELQTALAGSYTLVTSLTAVPVAGTGFFPGLLPPTDIVLTDRAGILVRNDVMVLDSDTFPYVNVFTIPGLGLPIVRGVNWVDIQVEGHTVRVANTHLESIHPGINLLQSQELTNFLDTTAPSRQIALGDFNSTVEPVDGVFIPTGSDLNMRLNNGFSDAWLDKGGGGPGFTWRDDELLSNPDPDLFSQRLDYAFHRGGFITDSVEIVGNVSTCPPGPPPCWPSDHAGVVATLLIPEPGSLFLIALGLAGAGFARRRPGV